MDEDAAGTEVDLVPGHIVLDGVPAPRERGIADPLLFGPCLLWPRSPTSATAELLLRYCRGIQRTMDTAHNIKYSGVECKTLHED